MLNIANRKECFFDDYLIDTEKTTAEFRVHRPVRKGPVMLYDEPWEGDGCNFHNILKDGDLYRLYYLGWRTLVTSEFDIVVCYAESYDGIHWRKPNLGICEFKGSKDNNIILDSAHHTVGSGCDACNVDNFMVFIDGNPTCPANEKYKAIALWNFMREGDEKKQTGIRLYTSADGIHFNPGDLIFDKGGFDSLNVCFWDFEANKYRFYFRAFHEPMEGADAHGFNGKVEVRDVRYMESTDFKNWSEPVMLDFGDVEDIPLYTSVAQPYPFAPHQIIGFPSRYIERTEWTDSFEKLCGKELRRARMEYSYRFGTVITDCAFIASHDGSHFMRHDEAFLPPDAEDGLNWLYGDGYPARGMIETKSDVEGTPNEISMYFPNHHWTGVPAELIRYTVRMDGFTSLHAGGKEETIVTKEFTYDGEALYINFSTSAWGEMNFTLVDADGNRYSSTCAHFGDTNNRFINFEDDAVAKLSGKPVHLEVRLRDADLYSIRFGAKK